MKNSSPYPVSAKTLACRQLLVEALCFGVLGIAAACSFGFAESVRIVLALAVAYAVPRGVLAVSAGRSRVGHFVLMALGMLMALCVLSALRHYAAGGCTLRFPELRSDDGGYYWWAVQACLTGQVSSTPRVPFIGFPLLMLGVFRVLGISVVWAVALNMMFTLLSVVTFGLAAVRIMRGRVAELPGTVAALAMALCALLLYFMSQGIRVQKEASCYLGLALVTYALARFSPEGRGTVPLWRDVLLLAVGTLLLALTRWTMSAFVLLGAALLPLAHWRRDWRQGLLLLTVAVAVTAACWPLTHNYGLERVHNIVTGGGAMSHLYITGPTQAPYKLVIGDYMHFSALHRLVLLPVCCAVQAVIPFPWLLGGLQSATSVATVLPRLGWGWYFILGVSLYYYIFMSWHRGRHLGLWALWPMLCFMGVAYVTGGSLNRYALPFEPLFAIVAAYTLLAVRAGTASRQAFKGWMVAFAVVLVAVLVLCYNLQSTFVRAAMP